jgi:hypothetical protein
MAGKGDKARNCFSRKFKDNFNEIVWGPEKTKKSRKKVVALPLKRIYNM